MVQGPSHAGDRARSAPGNNLYPNLYVGKNLVDLIPQGLYKEDWWYRTTSLSMVARWMGFIGSILGGRPPRTIEVDLRLRLEFGAGVEGIELGQKPVLQLLQGAARSEDPEVRVAGFQLAELRINLG